MEKNFITWKRVKLKRLTTNNITSNDIVFLFNCHQDYNTRYLYSKDMTIKSKNDFTKDFYKKLNYKYHEFMTIKSVDNDDEYIGFINSFRYNPNDGNLYTTICICSKYRNTIYGVQAGMAFYDYLFNKYTIRKIYCSVYDYNKMSMKFLKTAGFKVEGILKSNKYFNGKYFDMYIFSLYKEDFSILKKRLKMNKNEQ